MKLKKSNRAIVFVVGIIFCLGLSSFYMAGWAGAETVDTAVVSGQSEGRFNAVSLFEAADAMAQGNFEIARPYFKEKSDGQVDAPLGGTSRALEGLLSRYDDLAAQLDKARKEAKQEYIDKLNESVRLARWRESLLETSKTYAIESKEKIELETKLAEEARENWLEALAHQTAIRKLTERMNLPDANDKKLYDEIITRCLVIAKELEEKDEALEAFNKVYAFLGALDKQEHQYDDLHDRLLKEVTIKSMYMPDPNTEGISWQEKRKGVNTDIIKTAMATLDFGYVEGPDYKAMSLKALDSCMLLVSTEKLEEAFEQLGDDEEVGEFREELFGLIEEIEEISKEDFDYKKLLVFLDKVTKLNRQTVELPDEVVWGEFAEGAFDAVDNYTYVIWPSEVEEFRKNMTNEFSGIGIVISKDEEGYLKVKSLLSYDTPAYKSKLDAGDTIVAVDGKEARHITLEKAVSLITGPTGTKVDLTIDRDSFEEPKVVTVTRGGVIVPSVEGLFREVDGDWNYMLDPNNSIAYVRLTGFSENTPKNLRNILKKLKSENDIQALVLDLRENTGGYLSGAVSVVDNFISSGRIVSSRYRMAEKEDIKSAKRWGTFDTQMPLVVLVNSISASASEIVSGALKDHERALLIGTRTYGKGSVQTIQQLGFTSAHMKMTIAYYYLPKGRRVHRDPRDKANEDYGVEPDITLELTAGQMIDYAKNRSDAITLHRDDLPVEQRTWKIFNADEICQGDPQLEMARLCLQAHLLKDSPQLLQAAAAAKESKVMQSH